MNEAIKSYKKTIESIEQKQKEELIKIQEKINGTIAAGEFDCYIIGVFLPETLKYLKDEGYKVKVHSADIDEYGNMYPSLIHIYWNGKNNSFFKKIKILIKRIIY